MKLKRVEFAKNGTGQISGEWYSGGGISETDARDQIALELAKLGHECRFIDVYKADGRACCDDNQSDGEFIAGPA